MVKKKNTCEKRFTFFSYSFLYTQHSTFWSFLDKLTRMRMKINERHYPDQQHKWTYERNWTPWSIKQIFLACCSIFHGMSKIFQTSFFHRHFFLFYFLVKKAHNKKVMISIQFHTHVRPLCDVMKRRNREKDAYQHLDRGVNSHDFQKVIIYRKCEIVTQNEWKKKSFDYDSPQHMKGQYFDERIKIF